MADVEAHIMPGITHWQHPRFAHYRISHTARKKTHKVASEVASATSFLSSDQHVSDLNCNNLSADGMSRHRLVMKQMPHPV